jgi:hypothetical protein
VAYIPVPAAHTPPRPADTDSAAAAQWEVAIHPAEASAVSLHTRDLHIPGAAVAAAAGTLRTAAAGEAGNCRIRLVEGEEADFDRDTGSTRLGAGGVVLDRGTMTRTLCMCERWEWDSGA